MNKATTAYHYDSKTMHMDILHLAVVIAGFYPNVLPYSNWKKTTLYESTCKL